MPLPRNRHGRPYVPDPAPTDPAELLEMMNDASTYAAAAEGATAPQFDHGMRVFNQLHAHHQLHIAKELGEAHHALKEATNALKIATWWLAGVTIALGLVELFKLARGH